MSFFNSHIGRCATLLAIGGGIALYSQGSQTGSATVTVVDSAGAPVANARVIMRSPSLMGDRQGVTNAQGVFVARLLPPGNYTIEVSRDGFQTTRMPSRNIGMDQHYQPKVALQPIGEERVVVTASSMIEVDPTSVSSSSNYDAKRIDTLPTTRTPDGIASLTPGVIAAGMGGRIQVRGAMTSGNLYLVDGQNLMDNAYNNLQYPVITDSFEETQVITGAISAEYGQVDGGVINTITKSGGNVFSGQVRVDMTNPAWNARWGLGARANPDVDHARLVNRISDIRQYTLGGFLWKDKLWFFVSYYSTAADNVSNIGASALPWTYESILRTDLDFDPANTFLALPGENQGAGAQFVDHATTIRRHYKLTWMINQDHTVIGTYNNSSSANTNRNYSGGGTISLLPQTNSFEFYNFSWRATWSPTLNTEARFGTKKQVYATWLGKTLPTDGGPIYNYGLDGRGGGYYYNYGIFSRDGGDQRDNQTGNLKGSWFANWYGEHQLDFGVDYYKGERTSRNEQSPWNNISMYVDAIRYTLGPGNTVVPQVYLSDSGASFLVQWMSTDATASQETWGLYINDKWKINDNIALQIGVRWDTYTAQADDVNGTIASASGFSPRLGITYDLFGDQNWLFKASYCRYNSAVLETITGAVSGAGNPGDIAWYWGGAEGWYDYGTLFNQANWPRTNALIMEYYNPTANVKLDRNMKAPTCDEFQLSAQYSFNFENWGHGQLTLTGVKKTWKNLMDQRVGYDGYTDISQYYAGYDELLLNYMWANEPASERDYEALELSGAYNIGKFNFSGNITWSSLQGNYEGEGTNTPGSGESIRYLDNYYTQAGTLVNVYDYHKLKPYGYLMSHTPISIRLVADWTIDSKFGTTVLGWRYRFNSGQHYSHTRNFNASLLSPVLNPASAQFDYAAYVAFGGSFTAYENHQRRPYAFNASAYQDLTITHDFPLFKAWDYQVTLFGKVTIYNLFNHMQNLSWNVSMASSAVPAGETWETVPWVKGAQYGSTLGTGYWGASRSVELSAGIRF